MELRIKYLNEEITLGKQKKGNDKKNIEKVTKDLINDEKDSNIL